MRIVKITFSIEVVKRRGGLTFVGSFVYSATAFQIICTTSRRLHGYIFTAWPISGPAYRSNLCNINEFLCLFCKACPLVWAQYDTQQSTGGINYPNTTTVSDCKTLCLSFSPPCVAIDFDGTCWLHMNSIDLLRINTYNAPGLTQYIPACAPGKFTLHMQSFILFILYSNSENIFGLIY